MPPRPNFLLATLVLLLPPPPAVAGGVAAAAARGAVLGSGMAACVFAGNLCISAAADEPSASSSSAAAAAVAVPPGATAAPAPPLPPLPAPSPLLYATRVSWRSASALAVEQGAREVLERLGTRPECGRVASYFVLHVSACALPGEATDEAAAIREGLRGPCNMSAVASAPPLHLVKAAADCAAAEGGSSSSSSSSAAAAAVARCDGPPAPVMAVYERVDSLRALGRELLVVQPEERGAFRRLALALLHANAAGVYQNDIQAGNIARRASSGALVLCDFSFAELRCGRSTFKDVRSLIDLVTQGGQRLSDSWEEDYWRGVIDIAFPPGAGGADAPLPAMLRAGSGGEWEDNAEYSSLLARTLALHPRREANARDPLADGGVPPHV